MINQDNLNKVVICNENIGVIRYIGPIIGLNDDSEIWYGIEWKDSTRGKHDGTFKGKKYFHTKHSTGGSFVRPNKIDFGRNIWEAVECKYFDTENEKDSDEKDNILYNNFDLKAGEILVNCISLANSKISKLDSLCMLNKQFPHMVEIDLEGNLFNSWSQIFIILQELKNLKIINVSDNILTIPDDSNTNTIHFKNIQNLIMNRMNYGWNEIEKVLKYFPNLIELKVCFNQINEITSLDKNLLENLEVLDLEMNPIIEWKNILKFGHLKELKVLYANNVGISEIFFDDCDFSNKTSYFPKLKIVSINDNRINHWKSINELNKIRNLEDLRMKFNPLNNSDSIDNIRQMIISKLEKLIIFNRTKIENKERKGSEIDYLKKFGKIWLDLYENEQLGKIDVTEEMKLKRDLFTNEHPRYFEFIKKYGAAEESEIGQKNQNLKSSLISLKLKDEITNQKTLTKRLPLSTEIQRLKVLLSKLFKYDKIDMGTLKLSYKSSKDESSEYEIDNDFRPLGFYSIEDGDIILIRKQ